MSTKSNDSAQDKINLDSEINPESWTTKELLKHLYREQKLFRQEMLDFKKEFATFKSDRSTDEEVIKLRLDFESFKTQQETQDEQRAQLTRKQTTVIAVVISGLALLVNIIINFFKGS